MWVVRVASRVVKLTDHARHDLIGLTGPYNLNTNKSRCPKRGSIITPDESEYPHFSDFSMKICYGYSLEPWRNKKNIRAQLFKASLA